MVGPVSNHVQHFVLVELVFLVDEAARLYHELVETKFHFSALDDFLFYRIVGNKPKYSHLDGLNKIA